MGTEAVDHITPSWMTPSLRDLMETLNGAGHESFAVGGCVRDAVMGRPCNDIDVATNATPEQVKTVLKAAGWRLIPTGIEHGTWTAIKNKCTYEVTTYRRDVATDGRRATIEFAATMEEDSKRRDFTMNALYMDVHGNVYDPTGTGYDDAVTGLIRFVGDATERCEEDFLRILRFYRFYATLPRTVIDETALKACADAAEGLRSISKERVLSEVTKLVSTPDQTALWSSLSRMDAQGILDIVFPRGHDVPRLRAALRWEQDMRTQADWRARMYLLAGKNIELPFSKKDRVFIETLATLVDNPPSLTLMAIAQVHGCDLAKALGGIREENFSGRALEAAAQRKFTVTASDFTALGVEPGPELGKVVRRAKDFWLRSDMTATDDACVAAALEDNNNEP